jgi:hypothetical protein
MDARKIARVPTEKVIKKLELERAADKNNSYMGSEWLQACNAR